MSFTSSLNGWQRLWIVMTILYFIVVMSIAAIMTPGYEKPSIFTVIHKVRWDSKFNGLLKERHPSKYEAFLELCDRARYSDNGETGAKLLLAKAKELIPELNTESLLNELGPQTTKYWKDTLAGYSVALATWAIPSLLIYILGFSVAWVRRGFRKSS